MQKREIRTYFSLNIVRLYLWGWVLEATYLRCWILQDQRRPEGMLSGVEKVWCSPSDLFIYFLVEDRKKWVD